MALRTGRVPTPASAPWSYGCDGIKKDSEGNVYLANYAGSRVLITDRHGKLLHVVPTPSPFVDNMGLGPALPHHGRGAREHAEDFLYVSSLRDDSAQPYPGAIFQVKNPAR